MIRRVSTALLLAASLLTGVACKNQKAANPLAHVNSKQPDKVLFDRATEAMNKHQYDTARLTLQTLINAYPDSEYVARAKLTVAESWYQDGTTAGLAQAETEFRDFITFFPNMPESAEAQLKIAEIHYQQMGKPDRDYTHARRAEEEYRQLLMQYPDSKLADTARKRLLEVQEVLAEREFRIQHFYFLRGSLLASMARGKTLTDTYPLYSGADEALFLLGQAYEQQVDRTRASSLSEAVKQHLTKDYLDKAAEAYSKIVTRYPALPRYKDAGLRLAAINRPVPEPTPDAIALNKKELASRTPTTHYERFVTNMGKRPDLSGATRVGTPSMVDPAETDAPKLAHEIDSIVKSETVAASGAGKVTVAAASANGAVAVGANGAIAASDPAPHSPAAAIHASDVPAEAPAQLNEAASSSTTETASNASPAPSEKDDSKNSSSSHKVKKKRHFHIPLPM